MDYVDEIVVNGLLKSLASSVGYLLDETDPNLSQGILFEIRLELAEPDIIFRPPLDKNLQDNGKIFKLGIKPVFYFHEILQAYAYFIAYVH